MELTRTAKVSRKTRETAVDLWIDLDGSGQAEIDTSVGFLDHMIELFAHHALVDLRVKVVGDVSVDDHHSTEDLAICLGQAILQALGDKAGIYRYGFFALPMDEVLVLAALDLSGRASFQHDLSFQSEKIGRFDSELMIEFFASLSRSLLASIHLRQLSGGNSHHLAEGAMKAFARSLREAVSIDPARAGAIPSSKGQL